MPQTFEALQSLLTSHPVQVGFTVAILLAALYGFVSEKLPPDLTALLALLALLLSGVLLPEEAFAGFSHPATVSVAAVLVLTAGLERTGALAFLSRRLLSPLGRSEWRLVLVLMLVAGALSAFVVNTAVVAVLIPVVLEVCRRSGASPGRLLMPMAHAATFGGMCTLIGTSTNLVAHEFARKQGLPGFGMFEFGYVGLPMLLAGFAYVLLVGRWFLPKSAIEDPAAPERTGDYIAELVVTSDSPWIGRPVNVESLARDHLVELVRIVREDKDVERLEPHRKFQANDLLHVRGPLDRVLALAAREGLELRRPNGAANAARPEIGAKTEAGGGAPAPGAPAKLPLAEFIVLPGSELIGRTLKNSRFAERYGAVVLALHRPSMPMLDHPRETRIRLGDVLVLEGPSSALRAVAERPGFLVLGAAADPEERPAKVGIALFTIVGVVLVVALGVLPIVTAATAGCALLILSRCLTPREAYRAIDWSIVCLLAGALALGRAIEKTGISSSIASFLADRAGDAGPLTVVAAFLFASILLSEFMSNSGTVALLAPVALSTATQMGLNPMALLAAVAFGASAAFAMPIGYQTSLMIYGPGGYRFRDFVKIGIPLDILLAALALWLIPKHWPLIAS